MTDIVFKPFDGNKCFVCEMSPDVGYWDTRRFFDPPVHTVLNGRKLVCEECIVAACIQFGFPTPEAFQKLETELLATQQELEVVKAEADVTAAVKEAVEVLKPKRASIKKKADDSETKD